MRVVLKLGGSLLYKSVIEVDIERIRGYTTVLTTLVKEGHRFAIIVGGGMPARSYISAARTLGASEAQCDWLGIKIARANAELLCAALGDNAFPKVAESLDEMETAFTTGKIVLMGGLTPGQSTNAVAALIAEIIKADLLLNATNVDGVYDRNPSDPNATRYDSLSVEQLMEILSSGGIRAGEYKLFDPVAIRVIARSRIPTVIFNGADPNNVMRIINGEKIGTFITYNKIDTFE